MQYFVLRLPDGAIEVARLSPQGSPSVYDPETGTWIGDPLLGAEVRGSDDWVRTEARDLPASVGVPKEDDDAPAKSRRSRSRRGRHAQTS